MQHLHSRALSGKEHRLYGGHLRVQIQVLPLTSHFHDPSFFSLLENADGAPCPLGSAARTEESQHLAEWHSNDLAAICVNGHFGS